MSWRDFFYYSKGERRGLLVLLCLIAVAAILLITFHQPNAEKKEIPSSAENVTTQTDKQTPQQTSKQTATTSGKQTNTQTAQKTTTASHDKSRRQNQSVNDNDNAFSSEKNTESAGKTNNQAIEEMESVAMDNNDPESTNISKSVTMVKNKSESEETKESVSERVKRMTSYGRPSYPRTEKLKEGTVVELNTADTTLLKKVPGIGSTFAKRIVGYRNLLGGFYSIMQLSEVYGIDEDRYHALVPWFSVDSSLITKLSVNKLSQDTLQRHPYLNYRQAKVIVQLRRQKGTLNGWENLQLLDEFAESDKMRLLPYLSFE